jgi:hypothetical protein
MVDVFVAWLISVGSKVKERPPNRVRSTATTCYNLYERSHDPTTKQHFFKLLQEAKSWSKEKDDTYMRDEDGEWERVERGANDNRARRPSFLTMLQAAMGLETDRRIVGGQ